MILGDECTRNCKFCAVKTNRTPLPPDPEEPAKIVEAVKKLGLKYVVITSVTRDDLEDGGAEHFAAVIRNLKENIPGIKTEVLTPDFKGNEKSLRTVLAAGPTVFNHNVETVERLSKKIRSHADYPTSLRVLENAGIIGKGQLPVKSGLMVGLGETDEEVLKTIAGLRKAGVSILTIGQYLPPSGSHWKLDRYVEPEKFEEWKRYALNSGYTVAACAPLVRSSYNAGELMKQNVGGDNKS
jgi:lipoic acid synthetase